jgi:hypothetical protein
VAFVMAYSLTKISKDEKVCSILDEIENEKDILISSAKAFYEQVYILSLIGFTSKLFVI